MNYNILIIVFIIGILFGMILQIEYNEKPSFFSEINITANNKHILSDGKNEYYIVPYFRDINFTNYLLNDCKD